MNPDTGKMKRHSEMTEKEKETFIPIPEKMPISEIKGMSRSQAKRNEYMAEVARKKNEGLNR
jgi:hypothetical protein